MKPTLSAFDEKFLRRGFLPEHDPVSKFQRYPELQQLDDWGAQLPDMLEDDGFREMIKRQVIPAWPENRVDPSSLPELRLYYLRVGFLASGFVNQVTQPPAHVLPANLAIPLHQACQLLDRPPILSYDGYALYNWRRLDPTGPIALGNIDTIQNFVNLYDEHWFILVHVEIEAIAADILAAIDRWRGSQHERDGDLLNACLDQIAEAVQRQVVVLRRIPEHMRPQVYFRAFRPYIRFFEDVTYEGVDSRPFNFRGETGAQSSVMPALVAFMKIKHERTILTDHLADMRRFMPAADRRLLDRIDRLPEFRELASVKSFNAVLDAMADFREVHYGWADQYVHQRVADPRGTGGTPYMTWLKQLIDETRKAKTKPTIRSSAGTDAPLDLD